LHAKTIYIASVFRYNGVGLLSLAGALVKTSKYRDQETPTDSIVSAAPPCQTAFDPANPCCTILRSLSEGVFTIDLEKKVTFFNRAAESITGFNKQEALGQYCFDVFRSSVCQVNCPLDAAIGSGEPVYECAAVIINKQVSRCPSAFPRTC
jgi:PAS domain-containing protein